jgi:hypothetical protein
VGEAASGARRRAVVRYPALAAKGSSVAEVNVVSAVYALLHECGAVLEPLTAASLARVLDAGKAALETDARFKITGQPDIEDVLFEYDPAHTHGPGDVACDVEKTKKLRRTYPEALVVRLR